MAICWQIPHRCSQGEKKTKSEKKNKQHAIVLDYKWKQLQRRYNIGWPTRRSVHFHCVHCVQCIFFCVCSSGIRVFACCSLVCLLRVKSFFRNRDQNYYPSKIMHVKATTKHTISLPTITSSWSFVIKFLLSTNCGIYTCIFRKVCCAH